MEARDESAFDAFELTESERIEVHALMGEMVERARRGLVSGAFVARFAAMLAEELADRHEHRRER